MDCGIGYFEYKLSLGLSQDFVSWALLTLGQIIPSKMVVVVGMCVSPILKNFINIPGLYFSDARRAPLLKL